VQVLWDRVEKNVHTQNMAKLVYKPNQRTLNMKTRKELA
jgi:hypothetical protein